MPAQSGETTSPGGDDATVPRLARFEVPGVGSVEVLLQEHRFGMTGETMVMLREVYGVNGMPAGCEDHERTAEYLESVGIIH